MIRASATSGRTFPSAEFQTRSLARCLGDEIERNPKRIAVVDGNTRLTVEQLGEAAAAWQSRFKLAGVGRGSVVAVQLPNRWETIAISFAAWGLGAVVNLLTPIYRSRDLAVLFEICPPDVVVVPEEYRGLAYPEMIREALTGRDFSGEVLAVQAANLPASEGANARFFVEPVAPDEVCMLMYTSGTTGRPKGVLHTSRTLLVEAESIAELFGVRNTNVFMPSPLAHVTGLLYGMVMPVITRSSVVLLDRWSPDQAMRLIEDHQCRMTVAATPFLRGLTDSYRAAGVRSALRTFVCGGADMPPSLIAEAERVLGSEVARTYGSTEFPTLCAVRPGQQDAQRMETEGRPIGEAEARLSGGQPTGVGELEVSGPEMFVGYLDPEDNESAMTADGWFRTGDIARIDPDGTISIVGRVKDLIIRGGENISAKEVEDLLIEFPEVRDVAIVAFPDDLLGERVCAVVVSEDAELALTTLVDRLGRAGVALQKVPEALYLVDELPRTASGKVQKFELRSQVVEAIGRGQIQLREGISPLVPPGNRPAGTAG